jgi:hypothetical protein
MIPKKAKKNPHTDLMWFKNTDSLINNRLFKKLLRQKIATNYSVKSTLIKHPDFDDETRFIRRNYGKVTPVRLLKSPSTSIFFKDNTNPNPNLEMFNLRFNKSVSYVGKKPIRPTVYLTFKQKRYNQRVSIRSKNQPIYEHRKSTSLVYSGNPFLKNNAIVEENFGNPTRQYKLVKKAKVRVDQTKVAN